VADNDDFPLTVLTPDGTFSGRLTEEDVLEVVTYVNIEPVYEQTAKALLEAVASGAHEKPYLALWSALDQVRYLIQTDMDAYRRILTWLEMRNGQSIGPRHEDQHLEADYEDRHGYPDLDE
jgi:hypothetical protein